MRVADARWLDWAADGTVSSPRRVSVALATARWAGPVVDDQGDADQGEQHAQGQEKGGLGDRKARVTFRDVFRDAGVPHVHLGDGTDASPPSEPPVLAFVATVAGPWEPFRIWFSKGGGNKNKPYRAALSILFLPLWSLGVTSVPQLAGYP